MATIGMEQGNGTHTDIKRHSSFVQYLSALILRNVLPWVSHYVARPTAIVVAYLWHASHPVVCCMADLRNSIFVPSAQHNFAQAESRGSSLAMP